MKKLLSFPLLLLALHAAPAHAQKAKQTVASAKKPVYTRVDVMPQFNGDVSEYLNKAVRYPEDARKQKIEGRVVIKFVIDEKGRVTDAVVERSVNPALDAEALRAVKAMPNWKPATNNGKPVKVYYYVPVKFVLA